MTQNRVGGGGIHFCTQQSEFGLIINVWFNVQQPLKVNAVPCFTSRRRLIKSYLASLVLDAGSTRRLFLLGATTK